MRPKYGRTYYDLSRDDGRDPVLDGFRDLVVAGHRVMQLPVSLLGDMCELPTDARWVAVSSQVSP